MPGASRCPETPWTLGEGVGGGDRNETTRGTLGQGIVRGAAGALLSVSPVCTEPKPSPWKLSPALNTPSIRKGLLSLAHARTGRATQTPASGPTPCSLLPGHTRDLLPLGPGPHGALPSPGVCCPGPSVFEATCPPMRKPCPGPSADCLIHLIPQLRARGLAYFPGLPPPLGEGPQPREVFKGPVKGFSGPGGGEACPGWAAGPRPERRQEGQARRPLGRSLLRPPAPA